MHMRAILFAGAVLWGAIGHAQLGITSAEYFWDTDPGVGNSSPLVAVDGTFGQVVEQVLVQTATLPSPGLHELSIRILDEDGGWGPVFSTVLEILQGSVSFPDIHVAEGEYFWDTDPGEGNGSPLLAFDGNYEEALEAVGADINSLPAPGLHVLHMRVRDVDANWSGAFQVVVEVLQGAVSFPDIHVGAAEYWVDADPGPGAGTPMLASDGNFDQAFEAIKGGAIPVPVDNGVHVLWMRAQDDDGGWGPAFGVVVNIDTTITGTVEVPEAAATDPGFHITPNPTDASSGFVIEQEGEAQAIAVRVLDMQGRVVLEKRYLSATRIHIATEGWASGIYPVGVERNGVLDWRPIVVR